MVFSRDVHGVPVFSIAGLDSVAGGSGDEIPLDGGDVVFAGGFDLGCRWGCILQPGHWRDEGWRGVGAAFQLVAYAIAIFLQAFHAPVHMAYPVFANTAAKTHLIENFASRASWIFFAFDSGRRNARPYRDGVPCCRHQLRRAGEGLLFGLDTPIKLRRKVVAPSHFEPFSWSQPRGGCRG